MSIDGTYNVTVKTPLGPQEGRLTLRADGNSLSGVLENPKGNSEFDGGTVNDTHVSFITKIRTPVGRLKAEVNGEVEGDTFTGTAKLPLGTAQISGTRA